LCANSLLCNTKMSLDGADDNAKLKDLSSRNYKAQSIWFLNAFWKILQEKEAENVWNYASKMQELDKDKAKEGNQLDEFQAHRFLEYNKETLTVLQMREALFKIGIEKAKYVPLIAYLIFKYNSDWHALVNATQGDNQEEVARAQQMLQQVQKDFEEVQKTADLAAQREKEARVAEAAAKEAQAELEKSLADLHAQEDAYNKKTEDLTRKSEEGGVVAQNKAKAELAQHKAEDPLPLRRAKITNEAAVKKAEKATTAAKAAVEAAINAKAEAEKAVEAAKVSLEKAEAYLKEVKNKPGSAQGALWWIDRELHEARAYLPASKGGYSKKPVAVKTE